MLTQVRTLLGDRTYVPWVKTFLRGTYAVDEWLLAHVPPLRPLAGKVVVEYVAAGKGLKQQRRLSGGQEE